MQTSSCSSVQISSSMKKATLMIFSCISMKKPLLEVGKLEGMLVKSCWWLSRDSIGPWIRKFFTSLHRLQIQSRWNRWWHRHHWLLNSSNSELPWPPRCRAEKTAAEAWKPLSIHCWVGLYFQTKDNSVFLKLSNQSTILKFSIWDLEPMLNLHVIWHHF